VWWVVVYYYDLYLLPLLLLLLLLLLLHHPPPPPPPPLTPLEQEEAIKMVEEGSTGLMDSHNHRPPTGGQPLDGGNHHQCRTGIQTCGPPK